MSGDLSEVESQDAFEMFRAALSNKKCNRRPDGYVPAFDGVPLPNFCVFLGSVHSLNSLIDNGFRCDISDHKGNSPLHVASILNYCEDTFKGLLSNRDILEARSECGQTALHAAARTNNLLAAQEILGQYLGIMDLKDEQGNTALHMAFFMGSPTVAAYLIDQGADIDATDNYGRCAVHCAALSSSHKGVIQLQNAGVDIMAVDKDGRTILHYAAISNRSLIRNLLDKSVFDVNVRDKFGFTPLHYATMASSLKCIKSLCSYGASITAAGINGLTPFHVASSMSEKCSVLEFFASKLESEYMSIRMDGGLSPLHLAAEFNRISRVDLLLSEGVSANLATENGETALHVAAFNGDEFILKHLIDKSASVNGLTEESFTALHMASFRPCRHVLQILVENGAEIDRQSVSGLTPLMLAASSDPQRSFNAVTYLISNGANLKLADNNGWTALHHAVSTRNLKTVELLISNDADINGQDSHGRTILHLAVFNRDELMIDFIIGKKRCLWDTFDKQGFSPIHYAAINGSVDIVEKYLESITFETMQGRHPSLFNLIHLAAIYDKPDIIKRVCQNEEKNKRRLTECEVYWCGSADSYRRIPLHYAMAFGHLECVKLLAMKGTYLNWLDRNGFSPLHLAASNGQVHCLEFVLEAFSKPGLRYNLRDLNKRTFGMLVVQHLSARSSLFAESDLTLVDDNGRGYLHRAVTYRRIDLLPHLLRYIQPDVSDNNGVTPLHVAAHCGFIDVLRVLVEQGGTITMVDNKGMTPADYAAKNGKTGTLEYIIYCYTNDLKGRSDNQETGLPAIVTAASFMLSCLRGYFDCVTMLYELFEDFVKCRDNRLRTPLHNAAETSHYEIVEFLLEKKGLIDAVDEDGSSPMMLAAPMKSNSRIIDLLMNAGADASLIDSLGNNVLHIACTYRNEEALKVIVTHLDGSSSLYKIIEALNDAEESIFHICVRKGMIDCVKFLTPFISTEALYTQNTLGQIPLCAGLSSSQVDQLQCMLHLLPFYMLDDACVSKNAISRGDSMINMPMCASREDTSELEMENEEQLNE